MRMRRVNIQLDLIGQFEFGGTITELRLSVRSDIPILPVYVLSQIVTMGSKIPGLNLSEPLRPEAPLPPPWFVEIDTN